MKHFQTTPTGSINKRIVKELNASVLSLTFMNLIGTHKADLYKCINSSDTIVRHDSCPPNGGVFVETILISF